VIKAQDDTINKKEEIETEGMISVPGKLLLYIHQRTLEETIPGTIYTDRREDTNEKTTCDDL